MDITCRDLEEEYTIDGEYDDGVLVTLSVLALSEEKALEKWKEHMGLGYHIVGITKEVNDAPPQEQEGEKEEETTSTDVVTDKFVDVLDAMEIL